MILKGKKYETVTNESDKKCPVCGKFLRYKAPCCSQKEAYLKCMCGYKEATEEWK